MAQINSYRRLMRGLVVLACFFLLPAASRAENEQELPSRLILGVDGMAFHHVRALQNGLPIEDGRSRGAVPRCFLNYFPVSRMISTYPSKSELAWLDIFQLLPLEGYQPFHFSFAHNAVMGPGGADAMGVLVESHFRSHWFLKGFWRHLLGYLFPGQMYNYEMDAVISAFWKARGTPHFHAYITTIDYAMHMDHDPIPLLRDLDARLEALQEEYRRKTGRKLEIALISDHGNDDSRNGKRVEVIELLTRRGFRATDSLNSPKDVVVLLEGILNAFEVFTAPEDVRPVVETLLQLEGADLITFRLPQDSSTVRVARPGGEEALVRRKGRSFAYVPVAGDPLRYVPLSQLLKKRGWTDSQGFAPAQNWIEISASHQYPDAPERIFRGHDDLVSNPAPIIVSLKPGYVHADPLTKRLSRLVSLAGTHGALDARSSNGIVMANFVPTRDTLTSGVASYFDGFPGLYRFTRHSQGARIIAANDYHKSGWYRREGMADLFRAVGGETRYIHFWSTDIAGEFVKGKQKVGLRLLKRKPGLLFPRWQVESEAAVSLPCVKATDCLNRNTEVFVPLEKLSRRRLFAGAQYRVEIQVGRGVPVSLEFRAPSIAPGLSPTAFLPAGRSKVMVKIRSGGVAALR